MDYWIAGLLSDQVGAAEDEEENERWKMALLRRGYGGRAGLVGGGGGDAGEGGFLQWRESEILNVNGAPTLPKVADGGRYVC